VVTALGTGLNVAAAATPAAEPDMGKPGWAAAVVATGTWRGTLTIWIDHENLAQALKAARQLDAPDAAAISAALTDIVTQAAARSAVGRGSKASRASGRPCSRPRRRRAHRRSRSTWRRREMPARGRRRGAAAAVPASERLQAVLEVDLPLVVRFGRAVLPLKTLADPCPARW
jgi:hypothetical protein